MEELYKYPMALTQQFKMCGNPFRVDTYKGCDFGCKYCFASNRGGDYEFKMQKADMSIIEKNFKRAFDDGKPTQNITIEMMRMKVPMHLGGMSDPFQTRESKDRNTFKLIELSNMYNYPMVISTKGIIADEYFDILSTELHAFQISLISTDEQFSKKWESNSPSVKSRIEQIKKLKGKGFWVSLRLQPLISISHAVALIEEVGDYVDYITIEHLKISLDNKKAKGLLFDLLGDDISNYKSTGREYELNQNIKVANIEHIKSITNVPIGCGDNDIHHLSDSKNCCGIDTINDNFSNWIKYNSMYINMTRDTTQWFPMSSVQSTFNSSCRKKDFTFKNYVDDYIAKEKAKLDLWCESCDTALSSKQIDDSCPYCCGGNITNVDDVFNFGIEV